MAGRIAHKACGASTCGYAATRLPPPDSGMNNQRRQQRQPDPARAIAGEDLRREELLLDHHIEELLDAISALVDPPTTPT
jgi:hypothetical protein